MAKLDLTKYGITGTTEVVYNPSYINLRMLRPCTWAQGAATNDNWVNAVTWGAAQVQWYSRNDYAPTQFNETGKKYYYLALIDAAV